VANADAFYGLFWIQKGRRTALLESREFCFPDIASTMSCRSAVRLAGDLQHRCAASRKIVEHKRVSRDGHLLSGGRRIVELSPRRGFDEPLGIQYSIFDCADACEGFLSDPQISSQGFFLPEIESP
jgi:hypothetical protein